MEIAIDTFHVVKRDWLVQDHLVKGTDEKGVNEPLMKNGETDRSADKTKVLQMFLVDCRMMVDL